MLLAGAFAPGAHADEGVCRSESMDGTRFTVCAIDPENADLRIFWRDEGGRAYRSFSNLSSALEARGERLAFAMNGGMFQTDYRPVGLHIEDGETLVGLNSSDAPANLRPVPNFYKKPNGVFYVAQGQAGVVTSEAFAEASPSAEFATQSGPMLVIDGQFHPALIEGSRDRNRRTGVGVCADGMIRFAISEDQVNFHDFARFFRDGLDCPNALFLDGGRGTGLYSPEMRRSDWSWHGGFGPIVGLVETAE